MTFSTIYLTLDTSYTSKRKEQKIILVMWSILFTVSLCVFMVHGQVTDELPIVNTAQGPVAGSLAPEGGFYEFYGIPYADSTAGNHRFKAPSPPPVFEETYIADRKGIRCVRALGVGYEGTEDCLVSDVFTPSLNQESLLPVMVWVKGREFDQHEEPAISFRNIVGQDVVVVSLNYRESILGFLCLGTETAPGNAGLKDIIAGLRWVQENIVNFGGNPNSVTLFGHGSGAAAVDLVTLSPLAKGLVHKAIAQSGSSIAPWAVTRDPTKYAVIVAEALGHTITDIENLSEAFTRTSVAALMAVMNELELTDNSLAFAPCIENVHLEGDEKFLLKSPYNTLQDGEQLQIPMILGFVENEGTIRAEEALRNEWLDKMDESFTDFIQPDLEFAAEAEEQTVGQQIRSFYFDDGPITIDNIDDYIAYHGDTMIRVSALREARLRATTSPTYVYQFSYEGALGAAFVGEQPFSVTGASHSEELAYLFDVGSVTELEAWDTVLSYILSERWTNFAKTGEPSSEISPANWEPTTAENTNVLLIRNDDDLMSYNLELLIVNPYQTTVTFWEDIYSSHFYDAEGVWAPVERNEEDYEEVISGPNELDDVDKQTTENPEGEEEDDRDVDAVEPEEEDDAGEPDSASTAVGYTFLIITLFTILNKFHLSQIESF